MTQRHLFQFMLILFSMYLCIEGIRLFIDILPKLFLGTSDSPFDLFKALKPSFSSTSDILPFLLPSLTILMASSVFLKANNLATWLFPETNNSPLLIQLQPEEWLRWGITLVGIFLIGCVTIPAISTVIFQPLVMTFYPEPEIDSRKADIAFIDGIYWSSFIRSIGHIIIQGGFGLACMLFAPRLAAWIIRIQKHPKPSQND